MPYRSTIGDLCEIFISYFYFTFYKPVLLCARVIDLSQESITDRWNTQF